MSIYGTPAKYEGKPVTIVSEFVVVNNSIKLVVMSTDGKLIRVSLDDIIVDTTPEFGKIKSVADLIKKS